MLFQSRRFNGHKKILLILGVGAAALTVVACGSAAMDGDPSQGGAQLAPAAGGQNDNNVSLGAPAGVIPGDGLPPVSDAQRDESGTPGAPAPEGAYGETVVSILPVHDGIDCVTGASDPPVLFVEGERVTIEPVPGNFVFELDPDDLRDEEVTISRNVEDGISLGMPVPGLADVPEMIVEGAETAPEPVEAPPSIMPTSAEILPELIAIPVDSCGEAPEPVVSVGSGETGGIVLEPLPVPDEELPANVMIVEAPIESAAVIVAESFPPQYILSVESGLPNAATTFGDYRVKRDGNIVAISMTNYVQTDVMAAQVYGTQRTGIALGSDFTPGATYEVLINGVSWARFTAQ